ncbi:MAG: NAD-binding protein [Chloroflexi bacterium]|nr:NAD-binding protein [Chloroflexota bacterium]
MESFKDIQRQIRAALAAIALVIIIGVIGYMVIEQMSLLDAAWETVVTLATVGYGDIVPRTPQGRIFTILLIIMGLSVFAYGLQASATFIVSPVVREARQRRRIQRAINRLQHHYIICGAGELVDKTVSYLIEGAKQRQETQLARLYEPVDTVLDRIFGDDARGHFPRMRRRVRRLFYLFIRLWHRGDTLLDVVVVVTPSHAFADHLRENGLMAIEGDPTEDGVLRRAGIEHAHALMVMLDDDTESLLTVLTARALAPELDITAATQEDRVTPKILRVGANGVIAPFDTAGQFLNNATLRPAVNDFFNAVLYSPRVDLQTTAVHLWDDSPWIGQTLGSLNLRERFEAGVIGLRRENGEYFYAPGDSYLLKQNEILITVAPSKWIAPLQQAARGSAPGRPRPLVWQRLPLMAAPHHEPHPVYKSLYDQQQIADISRHYVICGSGRVARNAIKKLNPQRPFVIISDDEVYADDLRQQGFRVVSGSPLDEDTLRQAGVSRALALMVAVEDPAVSILAVLNARTLSRGLLITAAALTDDMIPKLRRAGADRVINPFQVAALAVLLTATRPAVSDFLQYVIFNPHVGVETTELYMQDDSPWIGRTVESLHLGRIYRAGVIGLRLADGRYLYAPPGSHILGRDEVLIVVTPMQYADDLRLAAHGSETKRPHTLRRGFVSD